MRELTTEESLDEMRTWIADKADSILCQTPEFLVSDQWSGEDGDEPDSYMVLVSKLVQEIAIHGAALDFDRKIFEHAKEYAIKIAEREYWNCHHQAPWDID